MNKEKLLNIFKRKPAFPDGNSLCYKGETTGHWQPDQNVGQMGQDRQPSPSMGDTNETPLIEGNIQTLFEERKNGETGVVFKSR